MDNTMSGAHAHGDEGVSRRSFVGAAMATGFAGVIGALGARNRAYAEEASDAEAGETNTYSEQELAELTGASHTNGTMDTPPDPIADEDLAETVECDMLVVGAGVAAMPGIIYAAQQGLNVHVLEKGPTQGVHRLNVSGLNPQYAKNFSDTTIDPKDFTVDFCRCSAGFQSKTPLVSRYATYSGGLIDWMVETITPYGWSLLPMMLTDSGFNQYVPADEWEIWPLYDCAYCFQDPDGNSIATGSTPNWMELFYEIAVDCGVTFHFNEPAYYLEREGEKSGRCTSVVSHNLLDDTYSRYTAANGILLAAGDFYNDKQMVHKYAPHLEKCITSITEPNNTGDMHKAGLWIGAAMDDYSAGDLFAFENAACDNWSAPVEGDENYNVLLDNVRGCMWAPALAGYPVLWVDDGGRRFVNEGMNMFQQAGAQVLLTTPTGKAWSIWDSEWESKFPDDWETNAPCAGLLSMMSANNQSEIDREVDLGLIDKYDTIEELIEGCGFDADYFQETLDRYNELCAAGYDSDCFKEARWMCSIDTPPYYAAHWGVMITSTRCGLKTDERGRVIDTEGKIIEGLYAAGNNGGNFYGMNYPGTFGGTGIAHGQFYSWLAAHEMAGQDILSEEE